MRKAFTLLELLVGIAIFSFFTIIATSLFLSASKTQRKVLAIREITDSISYVLEYMGSALRMAKKDDVEIRGITKNCLIGDKVNYEITPGSIKFRNYENRCQRFFLEGNRIKEEIEGFSQPFELTPKNLEVKKLNFFVSGDSPGDNFQPKVTLSLEVQRKGQEGLKISVQTTISQRDLDL